MKLGTKVSLVIVAVFVINAAVTVLFTMPDSNPAVSVAVIVSTHIITLSLAILAIIFSIFSISRSMMSSIIRCAQPMCRAKSS